MGKASRRRRFPEPTAFYRGCGELDLFNVSDKNGGPDTEQWGIMLHQDDEMKKRMDRLGNGPFHVRVILLTVEEGEEI